MQCLLLCCRELSLTQMTPSMVMSLTSLKTADLQQDRQQRQRSKEPKSHSSFRWAPDLQQQMTTLVPLVRCRSLPRTLCLRHADR